MVSAVLPVNLVHALHDYVGVTVWSDWAPIVEVIGKLSIATSEVVRF